MLDRHRRVVVTGGAGFIGSHLCEELVKLGKEVVAVDDLSTGKRENVPPGVEFVALDIVERRGIAAAMKGADLVFHVAAQPSTRESVKDPRRDFNSNALGTFNVLAAAAEAGAKRVVYTSSSAVYGEPGHLPLAEDNLPAPTSPYGASKLCGEHHCFVLGRIYGLACTCLRPFNVYGPRENPESSLDEVFHYTLAVLRAEPVTVHGDGGQTRDFVYAKDVAHAHLLAAERDESIGRALNVGSGVETSINDLVETIQQVTGRKATVRRKPWPEGDIYREYADVSLSRQVLGYSPSTELRDGIQELVHYFGRW